MKKFPTFKFATFNFAKTAKRALAGLLALLLMAEFGLRIAKPVTYLARRPQLENGLTKIHRRSDTDGLSYELRPRVRKRVFSTDIITNSDGMRGEERSIDKKPGSFRIAVLGDSYTFGL